VSDNTAHPSNCLCEKRYIAKGSASDWVAATCQAGSCARRRHTAAPWFQPHGCPYTPAPSGLGEPGRRHGLGEFHRGFSLSEAQTSIFAARNALRLDEVPPRLHLVAHQHREHPVGLDRVVDLHLQQAAHGRVHRGFPQLLGVHLAQALVALAAHRVSAWPSARPWRRGSRHLLFLHARSPSPRRTMASAPSRPLKVRPASFSAA
jgi:hypothetical protein